jgi:hypothetical protein
VLAASWLARAIFSAAIGDSHSLDVDFWESALSARAEGKNPYETGVLNWPPLWLEIIVVLNAIANAADVSFLAVLRVYLILVESAVIVTLYFTLVSVGALRGAVRRALLVGIALNPVMIILVCQHGNSDVNVALFVTLACAALIAYRRSRDVVVWLCASLLLGFGVLAKTTPLVLSPLLAPGARLTSRLGRALGLALLVLPAGLGMAVLLALVPEAIFSYVIEYRTRPGNFGIAGAIQQVTTTDLTYEAGAFAVLVAFALVVWLLPRRWLLPATRRYLLAMAAAMLGALLLVELLDPPADDVQAIYGDVFTLALIGLVVWLAYRLWREPPLAPETVFLLVAVIFMVVVAFGTGYGAHYAPWFLPALVATYVLLDDAWRRLLLVGYVIAALTYALEYAVVPFLGDWAGDVLGDPAWVAELGGWLEENPHWGAVRIPLFIVYLCIIAAGLARLGALMTQSSDDTAART